MVEDKIQRYFKLYLKYVPRNQKARNLRFFIKAFEVL